MRKFVVSLAVLLVGAGACAHADTVAIVGGTIIDGNGGTPIENGVILVDGERIIAVGGKSTVIPSKARVVAAAGKFVIPGLMDANVHLVLDAEPLNLVRFEGRYDELAIEAAQITLRNGVTTVFDTWGPRVPLVKARNAVNVGRVTASRIFLAGNIVGLGGPLSADFWGPYVKEPALDSFAKRVNALWQENVGPELLWMSPEQVRVEIRKYAHTGIDFVKYAVTSHNDEPVETIQFSPRVQQVIVEEARHAGLPVVTHTTTGEGVYLAIQAGVDVMQHCEVTGRQPLPAETVALIAQRRIPCALIPSTDKVLEWRREQSRTKKSLNNADESHDFVDDHPPLEDFEVRDLNERALLRAGAVVLLSTDGGVFSSDFLKSSRAKDHAPEQDDLGTLGEGHFIWLLALQQKGMKPMDALMAATRNIAKAYRVDKDLGTLEMGKIADLVILDRNPLEQAENYRSISLVMKAGKVIDRESLPTVRLLTAQTKIRRETVTSGGNLR